ncbi:MAG: hypothetical protein KJO61_01375 [Deltaproteobacteria bacterium]|nr:hypothetical protein [Deltaproteobacteria bacterium]
MNKVMIRITLFALITGMFLVVVSGCGYRCQGWAYRTAYRQVCKSWSGTHCSFWGSESYQERYCTRWIKDPKPKKKIQGTGLPPGKFIRKAGESAFPKNANNPTAGETYLLTQLSPFICELLKSDDIIKTLASMGQYHINKKYTTSRRGQFITKNFAGGFTLYANKAATSSLWIKPAHKNSWPFTGEELADLLSGLRLKVMRDHVTRIVGVAGRKKGKNRYSYLSYPFSIGMSMRHSDHRNRYDTATYDNSIDIFRICWKNSYRYRVMINCSKGEKK